MQKLLGSEGNRAVDHDLLAQDGWHDVGVASEGLELTVADLLAKWVEEQIIAHEGDAATDNDAARAEERDQLSDRESQ